MQKMHKYADYLGQVMRKHVLCHLRTTKVLIRLRECLNSMICILAISKVLRFLVASVAEQAGLNVTWSKIPEDTFSRDVAHLVQL